MRQRRKERNELLEKLKVRLGELKRKGESGVASQNLTRPKKMRREVVKKVSEIPSLPKEKDLDKKTIEGRVKWYSHKMGYGFISSGENNQDYFVHHSQVNNKEILADGDEVIFKTEKTPRGLQAVGVIKQEGMKKS